MASRIRGWRWHTDRCAREVLIYDVALSVLACLRAGTDVHVAWVVTPTSMAPGEAVAMTPGGGHVGALLGGALDHALSDATRSLDGPGRLIEIPLSPTDALISGMQEGTVVTLALLRGDALPASVWEEIAQRRPVGFSLRVDDGKLSEPERIDTDTPGVTLAADLLVTSLYPVTRVVVSGGGPIAGALARAFDIVGWQISIVPDVTAASGMMATLSTGDAVVVIGHDVEASGRALQAAIQSRAGYIGSVGSPRMQNLRRDWLAFRSTEVDDRVHGPAGIDIGASTPGEIAIAIVAEALAVLHDSPAPSE